MKWKFRIDIVVDLSGVLHIQTILRGPLNDFGDVLMPHIITYNLKRLLVYLMFNQMQGYTVCIPCVLTLVIVSLRVEQYI